jgi:hypothetical protein
MQRTVNCAADSWISFIPDGTLKVYFVVSLIAVFISASFDALLGVLGDLPGALLSLSHTFLSLSHPLVTHY